MGAPVDVVVVGAGLSGLTAARRLVAAGRSVRVIEARARVGGRTLSEGFGGARFDLGGQWVGPKQHRVVALARELGLVTFPTHDEGRKVLVGRRAVTTYGFTVPKLSVVGLLGLARTFIEVELAARRLPAGEPWRARDAEYLDRCSAEDLSLTLPEDAKDTLHTAIRTVFGAEPRELSKLYFLAYQHAGGGLLNLSGVKGGAQERRFLDGAQSLSLKLAERLDVVKNAPVRGILQTPDSVAVHADGLDVKASRAIVAIPPNLTERITFSPQLPPARANISRGMVMGATVKVLAFYSRPFWRLRKLSGEAVFAEGPVSVAFDNTSRDGSRAALLAFIVGDEARAFRHRPAGERRAAVLASLARAFGDEASDPTAYAEHDWTTEEWTGGCPVANAVPGAYTTAGPALRAPVGRVHWAGTETATASPGYMEGAIEAGERAAGEVLALGR
jgi:monoamine oxidase